MPYTKFARVYDRFMKNTPYAGWADGIERAWLGMGEKPRLVLDLACGTGAMTLELAGRGYEMIGADISPDMLNAARTKAEKAGQDILFLNQGMAGFDLYGTVDAIVCVCDSINYLTRKSELRRLFALAANFLNPGGSFIFDAVTAEKFRKGGFHLARKSAAYIAEGFFNEKTRVNVYETTFFVRNKNGSYARFEETHVQRAHSPEEFNGLAAGAGLELFARWDGNDFGEPRADSERVFFAFRKAGA